MEQQTISVLGYQMTVQEIEDILRKAQDVVQSSMPGSMTFTSHLSTLRMAFDRLQMFGRRSY